MACEHNNEHKTIAFIGLDSCEVPIFAHWRPKARNMMDWLCGLLFAKSCERKAHFMVAMDYICGIQAAEYLYALKQFGEGWENVSIDMHTVFGLGSQRALWHEKRKYYKLRQELPEKRYTCNEKRNEFMLNRCDELILMTDGKSENKKSLIEKCTAYDIELAVISPDIPMIGESTLLDESKKKQVPFIKD